MLGAGGDFLFFPGSLVAVSLPDTDLACLEVGAINGRTVGRWT